MSLKANSKFKACENFEANETNETNEANETLRYFVKERGMSFVFQQLFESSTSTYTYILGDDLSFEAIIIDPVLETVDRDLKLISEMGLKLKYILDTHVHADHITGSGLLRERTGAQIAISAEANLNSANIHLQDGDELRFGRYHLKALSTPGHTNGCMSFYCEGRVFTGDSLMIRSAGRTDFQQGSSDLLYQSITQKLFSLPDETLVYPGHDYRGMTASSIALEKRFNTRVGNGRSLDEFKLTMSELKLSNPKRIHESVPANMMCGVPPNPQVFHPQKVDGIPEITSEDLENKISNQKLGSVLLIDVRRPEEFVGEYGHIPGSQLCTLGDDLESFLISTDKEKEIVFICRSGGRSAQAVRASQNAGFKYAINLAGGMIRWNDLKFKVEY